MRSYFHLMFIVAFLFGCEKTSEKSMANDEQGWKLLYRNDSAGKPVFGNKQELIDAARMGYPIRVGFGSRRANDSTKSIEHIAEVQFLTISNSTELFAQIQPITGQRPELENDTLSITFRENIKWTILVGTNGFSDRLSIDRFKDTIIGHRNRPTEVSWFAYIPHKNDQDSQNVWPLWKQ